MTHSLTLEVPEKAYQSLAEKASKKGQKVEEMAAEMLLTIIDDAPDDDDFERLTDELADYFEKNLPPDAKPLSDQAMSREGIYEDHL